ncbi:MAG: hypothetical protein WC244_03645 [Patescibacteria group bacterium]
MNKIFVQKIKLQKGQGLMELIVAIGVITVGLFSVWSLFFANFAGEQEAETRMVASNLAREGLEVVKNIRDSNWLAVENNATTISGSLWTWDNGFATPGYYVLGQLFSTSSSYVGSTTLISITDPSAPATKLYINKDRFYDHDPAGSPAMFSRFITVKDICCASANNFTCDNSTVDFKSLDTPCSSGQIKIGVDVASEVRWQSNNNQSRKVILENQLFNWR